MTDDSPPVWLPAWTIVCVSLGLVVGALIGFLPDHPNHNAFVGHKWERENKCVIEAMPQTETSEADTD